MVFPGFVSSHRLDRPEVAGGSSKTVRAVKKALRGILIAETSQYRNKKESF